MKVNNTEAEDPGKAQSPPLRFGIFELDVNSGELRKAGAVVKLQPQPFKILTLLASRAGQLVTREEIQQQIWGDETFVDFERGLNFCISQIRVALGDDAETPRYIETLPKRGYRFIVSIEHVDHGNGSSVEPSLSPKAPLLEATALPAAPASNSPPTSAARVAPLETSPVAEVAREARQGKRRLRRWALVGTAILAVGVLAFSLVHPAPVAIVTRIVQLTHDQRPKGFTLMTDGARVYFSERSASGHMTPASVSVTGGETTTISTPFQDALVVNISPDGSELLVAEALGLLWALPTAGGSPRRLGNLVGFRASWSPDGQKILYIDGNDLYVARSDGTEPRKLVTAPGEIESIHWSPDGKRISLSVDNGKSKTLWEASADGTSLHPVLPDWSSRWAELNGHWTPDGKYLLFESDREGPGEVWAIPERTGFLGKTNGKPMRLTEGPMEMWTPTPSKDGTKIFVLGGLEEGELVQYDSKSRHLVPYLSGISAGGLSFSRDGKWVVYSAYPEGTLWRSKVDGSERLQLTFPPMELDRPPLWATSVRWSPDGKQIAFAGRANPGSNWSIYVVSSAGGTPERIAEGGLDQREPNWSPDGNSIMYMDGPAGNDVGKGSKAIEILDLRTHSVSTIPGSEGLIIPRWSPDGRYIVAESANGKKLMLFDFTSREWSALGEFTMIVSLDWSHDGKCIYTKALQQPHGTSFFRLKTRDRKWEQVVDLNALPAAYWAGIAPDDSLLELRVLSQAEIYALDWQAP